MQTGLKIISKWYFLFSLFLPPQSQANTIRPVIFVSVPPQKQIIEKLAGEYVDVLIMLSPGQSPETFAPTPKQISSLARASSYIEAGVPFEITWRDSIRAVNPDIRVVSCCESLYYTRGLDHERSGNIHVWTDPLLTIELARLAMNELTYLLPGNEDQLRQNFLELESELRQLHAHIENRLAKRKTNYFIISHSALDAFSDRYDLRQLSLETNGREIGLNSLKEMVQLSRRENIRTLFVIEQYRSPLVANLAEELDAEIISLDILAENYIENMIYVSEQIARALEGQ